MASRVVPIMLVLAVAVSGCSWMTDFIIVNKTAFPIVIEYTLSGVSSKETKLSDIIKPKVAEIQAIGNVRLDSLPDAEITYDPNTKVIRFEIEPGKAAYLFRELNYPGFRSEEDLRKSHTPVECPVYEVKSFMITGKYGKAQYAGAQVTRDFVKKSKGTYDLTYE
jgi:hypothetical protein